METHLPLLIVDEAIPESPLKLEWARDATQALQKIEDHTLSFRAIFLDPHFLGEKTLTFIRLAHQHRMGTPLYFLHSDTPLPFTSEELNQLAIQATLQKPIDWNEVQKVLSQEGTLFDEEQILAQFQSSTKDSAITLNDASNFVAILGENFLSGKKSYFDLFVQIKGHFVRVVRAGEEFSLERLKLYLSKSSPYFYVKKEAQSTYLAYCDYLDEKVKRAEGVDNRVLAMSTMNLGQETLSYLKNSGVNATKIQYAVKFVDSLREWVDEGSFLKQPVIHYYLSDLKRYEHAVSVALLTHLLCRALGFHSEKFQRALGLAAFLHDIGGEHEKNHAQIGAAILRKMPGIDWITVIAVEQHHERQVGNAGQLQRVSEMIGICDEFSKRLDQPLGQIFKELLPKFSISVGEGFLKIFQ